MKRKARIAGLAALVMVGILGVLLLSTPKKGTVVRFAELHEAGIGSVYVVGLYGGWNASWSVSFLHRNEQGQWFSYFLANDALLRWRRVNLQLQGKLWTAARTCMKTAGLKMQALSWPESAEPAVVIAGLSS